MVVQQSNSTKLLPPQPPSSNLMNNRQPLKLKSQKKMINLQKSMSQYINKRQQKRLLQSSQEREDSLNSNDFTPLSIKVNSTSKVQKIYNFQKNSSNQSQKINDRVRNLSNDQSSLIQQPSIKLQKPQKFIAKKQDINSILSKNFQLPPRLNQSSSNQTFNFEGNSKSIFDSKNYGINSTSQERQNNHISDKPLFPLVNRISSDNKFKIAEISQKMISLSNERSPILQNKQSDLRFQTKKNHMTKPFSLNLQGSLSTGKLKLPTDEKIRQMVQYSIKINGSPSSPQKNTQSQIIQQIKQSINSHQLQTIQDSNNYSPKLQKNHQKLLRTIHENDYSGMSNRSNNNRSGKRNDLIRKKSNERQQKIIQLKKSQLDQNIDLKEMLQTQNIGSLIQQNQILKNSISEANMTNEDSLSPPKVVNLMVESGSHPVLATSSNPSFFDIRNMNQQQKKSDWPISSDQAIDIYSVHLTMFEIQEIKSFAEIYYINTKAVADEDFLQRGFANNGFDDESNYYRHKIGEHLMYRYEIIERLGKGSFGQVYKCFDHKLQEEVALKIIRNKQKFHKQALIELKILDHLRRADEQDRKHVVKMKEAFLFRNHLCITFEMLNINLYQMLKACKFKGFDIKVVKNMAIQILISLRFLKKNQIVHCDLKPENILLKYFNKSMLKIIDFGSSCYLNERLYTYIQSRFYRSPEVILGIPYDYAIDMWSFGCIMYELVTGTPIFSGESESDQMGQFIEILGLPPKDMLAVGTRSKLFFEEDLETPKIKRAYGIVKPNKKNLKDLIGDEQEDVLIDFINACLEWNPKKRITPEEALNHIWLEDAIKRIKK